MEPVGVGHLAGPCQMDSVPPPQGPGFTSGPGHRWVQGESTGWGVVNTCLSPTAGAGAVGAFSLLTVREVLSYGSQSRRCPEVGL